VNKTLGIRTYVDRLINNDSTLNEDGIQVMQKVFECMRRVCLSTNADIDFFYLILIDKRLGVEIIIHGYIIDVLKFMFKTISRDDFFLRVMDYRNFSTGTFGQKIIKNLFKEISQIDRSANIKRQIRSIIRDNFDKKHTTIDDFYSLFSISDLSKKERVKYKILNSKSLPISREEELFYLQVKEKYIIKEEYENETLGLSNKFLQEYLFIFSVKNFSPVIKKIYPLNKGKAILPEKYQKYIDTTKWETNYFFVEDISLPQFLANQIAKRIKSQLLNIKDDTDKASLLNIQGKYIDHNFNSLELIFDCDIQSQGLSDKNIIDISSKIFKNVCMKYKFFKFKKLVLFDMNKNKEIKEITIKKELFKRGSLWQEAFGHRDY
jgi:hypothetical protein